MTQSYAKTQRSPVTEVYWDEDESEEDQVDSQNQSEIQNENENPNRTKNRSKNRSQNRNEIEMLFYEEVGNQNDGDEPSIRTSKFQFFFSKWGLVTFKLG
jgi:hypothetical protein